MEKSAEQLLSEFKKHCEEIDNINKLNMSLYYDTINELMIVELYQFQSEYFENEYDQLGIKGSLYNFIEKRIELLKENNIHSEIINRKIQETVFFWAKNKLDEIINYYVKERVIVDKNTTYKEYSQYNKDGKKVIFNLPENYKLNDKALLNKDLPAFIEVL